MTTIASLYASCLVGSHKMTTIASLYASCLVVSHLRGVGVGVFRSRLERLVARLKHGGYLLADHPSVETLVMTTDQRLDTCRSIIYNPWGVHPSEPVTHISYFPLGYFQKVFKLSSLLKQN